MQVSLVVSVLQKTSISLGLSCTRTEELTREDFKQLLAQDDVCDTLLEVGVDIEGLSNLEDYIFWKGSIGFNEFLETVLQLRGSNAATVKDLVDLRMAILREVP